MRIILGSDEQLHTLDIEGRQGYFQGANRATLEFQLSPDEYAFDQLAGLFGDGANTGQITVVDDTDPGNEKRYLYEGYTLRVSASLQPVALRSTITDGPVETEERICVTMAQTTLMERQVAEVLELLPGLEVNKRKAEALDVSLPGVVAQGVQIAGGDYAVARQIAAAAAAAVPVLPVRDWQVGMETLPGEFVWDPAKEYAYMYGGQTAMTHNNQTFFPGAQGVYYWIIVPKMHEGRPVFPGLPGIVVFVQKGSEWWNADKRSIYRWAGDDYQCPSNYYPGAVGVYQWQLVSGAVQADSEDVLP